MLIKVSKSLSDVCMRFWNIDFYEDEEKYAAWFGGGYYDLETKKLYGWDPFTMPGINSTKIETYGGDNYYILMYDEYVPTHELNNWWHDHKHDREELILKLIVDLII